MKSKNNTALEQFLAKGGEIKKLPAKPPQNDTEMRCKSRATAGKQASPFGHSIYRTADNTGEGFKRRRAYALENDKAVKYLVNEQKDLINRILAKGK